MKNKYSYNIKNGNAMSKEMLKNMYAYLGFRVRGYNFIIRFVLSSFLFLIGLGLLFESYLLVCIYMGILFI